MIVVYIKLIIKNWLESKGSIVYIINELIYRRNFVCIGYDSILWIKRLI